MQVRQLIGAAFLATFCAAPPAVAQEILFLRSGWRSRFLAAFPASLIALTRQRGWQWARIFEIASKLRRRNERRHRMSTLSRNSSGS